MAAVALTIPLMIALAVVIRMVRDFLLQKFARPMT
jgi:hypothetical protein